MFKLIILYYANVHIKEEATVWRSEEIMAIMRMEMMTEMTSIMVAMMTKVTIAVMTTKMLSCSIFMKFKDFSLGLSSTLKHHMRYKRTNGQTMDTAI